MRYIESGGEGGAPEGCIFCSAVGNRDDEAAFVLHRGPGVFVILNAFPYNSGHLMVAPVRHVGDLGEMGADERTELMEVTFQASEIVRRTMKAEGFNLGLNLGAAAGAGIPGHLHMHVVPRWAGDTNFMPVVGDTKVLPEMLADTYSKLRSPFAALESSD